METPCSVGTQQKICINWIQEHATMLLHVNRRNFYLPFKTKHTNFAFTTKTGFFYFKGEDQQVTLLIVSQCTESSCSRLKITFVRESVYMLCVPVVVGTQRAQPPYSPIPRFPPTPPRRCVALMITAPLCSCRLRAPHPPTSVTREESSFSSGSFQLQLNQTEK